MLITEHYKALVEIAANYALHNHGVVIFSREKVDVYA